MTVSPSSARCGLLLSVLLGIHVGPGSEPGRAFASGPGTCTDDPASITGMLTRPRNLEGTGPFLVATDMMSSTYTPGATHNIFLLGMGGSDVFTGFLVYGVTALGHRVGQFDKASDVVGEPVATCPDDPGSTASHTALGPVFANAVMIPWTAPPTDVGPITFHSIVLAGTRGNVASQSFYFPPDLVLTPRSADNDGDGFSGDDCDDTDPAINPGAQEVCDGIDNDCDLKIDEADDDVVLNVYFRDQDSDLFGDPLSTSQACQAPVEFVTDDLDCDDADARVHPGAFERCDLIDNDCDMDIDGADADNPGCDVLQRDGFETDLPPRP